MKLKQYLKEKCNMTYAEYQNLPDIDRWMIDGEFRRYNILLQQRKQARENFIKNGGIIRQSTQEELEIHRHKSEIERKHRESSMKCGGVDGNCYIAIHHRYRK